MANDAIRHLKGLINRYQNFFGCKCEIAMNNSSLLTSFSNPHKPLPYIALLRLSMLYMHTNNFIGFWPGHYIRNIRNFKAKKPRSGTFSHQYFLFIQLSNFQYSLVFFSRYRRLLKIGSISHGVDVNNNFKKIQKK